MIILAVDPGSEKCGLAVLSRTSCFFRQIVSNEDLFKSAESLVTEFGVKVIVMGDGTAMKSAWVILEKLGLELIKVNETNSTLEGRKKYFEEHPPRGLKRMLPEGMRVPGEAFDDYVAELIGRRYFEIFK
ncbi:MAG: resolvase [Candidatus Wallbacteria bacterium]|nr:resolvase [Candidatus Wallbacteria bacterium]